MVTETAVPWWTRLLCEEDGIMELKRILAIALVMLLLITVMAPCCSCSSMSLGAKPKSINEMLDRSSTATLNVYVMNYGTDSFNCTLYVDEAYKPWVKLDPSTFTLDGNKHQKVNFTITAPPEGEDTNDFDLYIIGSSTESNGTPLNAGLKIPVTISLTNSPASPIWINPHDEGDGNTSLIDILIKIALLLLIISLLLIIILLWKRIQR